ncbi:Cysteine desulfuration protein SufE [Parachlamydia sp. AcF125]|nr:Cysteine desulfuration protein SufE [Parachlamydia sp. AcF125]
MFVSCLEKQNTLKEIFKACLTEEKKYQKIIELGRGLPRLLEALKIPENKVKGCQSTMYLHSYMEEGKVYFEAESDALISSGLAAILIQAYSGETPETILKCPPDYLEVLGISASLTPNRANGLYSIHLRMKQDALKFLLKR